MTADLGAEPLRRPATDQTFPGIGRLREQLSGKSGEEYWRTLEEMVERDPALQAYLDREFHSQRGRFLAGGASRRDFLRLMGASLALAGVGSCTRQPEEMLVPYAAMPENRIPGRPQTYATALPQAGGAFGVLVESHGGRPTKIEGNGQHPASLGATDRYAQAEVLRFWDPDRSQRIHHNGRIGSWDQFVAELRQRGARGENNGGEGFAILTEEVVSPILAAQLAAVRERMPAARIVHWQPLHRDNARRGAELAFGRDVAVQACYGKSTRGGAAQSEVVVSFDADFLGEGADAVRASREFAGLRRVGQASRKINRLWMTECSVSITGAMADERRGARVAELELAARALAKELGVSVSAGSLPTELQSWVAGAARDLQGKRGASLVIAGPRATPITHALVHAMNAQLGNVGQTVQYTRPVDTAAEASADSLRTLVTEMKAGRIHSLVMLGGNPVYAAPGALDFATALQQVEWRAHLSLYEDETSRWCNWHVPQTHALEEWGVAHGPDGTLTTMQPLIAPIYEGHSNVEVMSALVDDTPRTGHEMAREALTDQLDGGAAGGDGADAWRKAVHDGLLAGTAFPALSVTVDAGLDFGAPSPARGNLDLVVKGDASALDGRYANNAWLQELPRPVTLVTWKNPIYIAPATAERLDVVTDQVVEITAGERTVRGPVFVVPGHPEDVVTLTLGYGRTVGGNVANGVGFNAAELLAADGEMHLQGAELNALRERERVVHVQEHANLEGRDIYRETTFTPSGFEQQLADTQVHHHEDPLEVSLYPERLDGEAHYQWGMTIDLSACTGCNACVMACVAENNIPIVGEDEVAKGREMHWIRIDRYYVGDLSNPKVRFMPVPCMHCERAPCEVVCPVNATAHSPEGLNEMVYNRCVGTRYCANNCPYKVRRFNFFLFQDFQTESYKAGRNPDVTVRSRGVMEKCTYCVQRINKARIQSKVEKRPIRDGEIVTACEQVCPTQAITFGDVSDPESRVSRAKTEPHNYHLLGEVGTKPRTTYLAKVTNPADGGAG